MAICGSSFEKYLFRFFAYFLIQLFMSCMSSYIFYILTTYHIYSLQRFLPFCRFPFYFVDYFLCSAQAFYFNATPLVYICFHCLCSWCHIQKIISQINVKNFLPMSSSSSFIVSDVMFKSLLHFELIIVYSVR